MSGLLSGIQTHLGRGRIGPFFAISKGEISRLERKAAIGRITAKDLISIGQRLRLKELAQPDLYRLITDVIAPTVNSMEIDDKVREIATRVQSSLKAIVKDKYRSLFSELKGKTEAKNVTENDLEELRSFLGDFPEFCEKPGIGALIVLPVLTGSFDQETRKSALGVAKFCIKQIEISKGEMQDAPAQQRELFDPDFIFQYPGLFKMVRASKLGGDVKMADAFYRGDFVLMREIVNEKRSFFETEFGGKRISAGEYSHKNDYYLKVLEELRRYSVSG